MSGFEWPTVELDKLPAPTPDDAATVAALAYLTRHDALDLADMLDLQAAS